MKSWMERKSMALGRELLHSTDVEDHLKDHLDILLQRYRRVVYMQTRIVYGLVGYPEASALLIVTVSMN